MMGFGVQRLMQNLLLRYVPLYLHQDVAGCRVISATGGAAAASASSAENAESETDMSMARSGGIAGRSHSPAAGLKN